MRNRRTRAVVAMGMVTIQTWKFRLDNLFSLSLLRRESFPQSQYKALCCVRYFEVTHQDT
jgi:hypothetical protein